MDIIARYVAQHLLIFDFSSNRQGAMPMSGTEAPYQSFLK